MTRHSIRPRSIAMVGFMAAGKTTVGRRLADRLALPFIDTDAELEREFGMPVGDIFSLLGENVFRTAERTLIARLAKGSPRVLSLGGGAFADGPTRARLKAAEATTVWLDPPFELLLKRLAQSTTRPLALNRPTTELRALWRTRRQVFAEADIRIETTDSRPEPVVDRILRLLPQSDPWSARLPRIDSHEPIIMAVATC